MLKGAAVSWKSNQRPTIALSSAEAKHVSICGAAKVALYLRQLLGEKRFQQPTRMTSCLKIATVHPQYCCQCCDFVRTKHVQLRYHFVGQVLSGREIALKYCPSVQMLVDPLTCICIYILVQVRFYRSSAPASQAQDANCWTHVKMEAMDHRVRPEVTSQRDTPGCCCNLP